MKECDILGEGVKTYSDPSYIFSGGQDPDPPGFAPLTQAVDRRDLSPNSASKNTLENAA